MQCLVWLNLPRKSIEHLQFYFNLLRKSAVHLQIWLNLPPKWVTHLLLYFDLPLIAVTRWHFWASWFDLATNYSYHCINLHLFSIGWWFHLANLPLTSIGQCCRSCQFDLPPFLVFVALSLCFLRYWTHFGTEAGWTDCTASCSF